MSETKQRGQTHYDRAWTRYNCLNKGLEVPDWARPKDESDWYKDKIDKHNAKVRGKK